MIGIFLRLVTRISDYNILKLQQINIYLFPIVKKITLKILFFFKDLHIDVNVRLITRWKSYKPKRCY